MEENESYDAIVIGGGFYGASIAIYLNRHRGFKKIVLLEREKELLSRASYNNQARIHNGYHYPRSFTTAYRSRVNFPKFLQDWPSVVKKDFVKIYAIARGASKITSTQFQKFCTEIGAPIKAAAPSLLKLLNPHRIESAFLVEECAFDAAKLAKLAEEELRECRIHVRLQTSAVDILKDSDNKLRVCLRNDMGVEELITSTYVFNCTYSGLNQIHGDFLGTHSELKHELAELALIKVPQPLQDLGITIMDGPFFSILPFPDLNLHTLTHVRYTPHINWKDDRNINPYEKLRGYKRSTYANRMIRDAGRFLPFILDSKYINSLFEIKTVLQKNEGDDGRPILFEKYKNLPGLFSIMGSKIDNIYDILERLDEEVL